VEALPTYTSYENSNTLAKRSDVHRETGGRKSEGSGLGSGGHNFPGREIGPAQPWTNEPDDEKKPSGDRFRNSLLDGRLGGLADRVREGVRHWKFFREPLIA